MSFLAMAGKQVLPDEIKIRELAEQISIKADPKNPQSGEILRNVTQALVTLQEHVRDRSIGGLLSRLQLLAKKHNLKFQNQDQQFNLASDNFCFEITADVGGVVTCVKLSIGSHPPLEDSSQLRMELCKWNFKTLEDHIISLQSLTSRLESVDRNSAFKVLLATENILATVAKTKQHHNLIDMVLNGCLGHVTPRRMGLGMKLTMFASPKEYFKDQMLTTTMCSVPDNFGYSLLVSTEASTQTYHLPVDPNLYSSGSFQTLTSQNSISIPITLLLHLSRETPISGQTMFSIYNLVYVTNQSFQWPAGRHTDELIIRGWAKKNSYDQENMAAPNSCHTVLLPTQCHRYFHGKKWSKQESIIRHECGVSLTKIPFLQPKQVPLIVQLMRQQLVYNHLYETCCGPVPLPDASDCNGKVEYAINVEGSPPEKITLELDLLNSNSPNIFIDVVVPDVSPFKPKVNVRINSQQQITPSPTLSEALARCLSIPVLLHSALNKTHLLGPLASSLISSYHKEMRFDSTPPPAKQPKLLL